MLVFLLVLSSGGILHIVFGAILSPLFYLLLCVLYVKYNHGFHRDLLIRLGISQLIVGAFMALNWIIVPFYNDLWFYVKLYLRITSVNIFLMYLLNEKEDIQRHLFGVMKFISWHAVINFVLAPLFILIAYRYENEINVNTLLFIFNYESLITFGPLELFRNQSFFWEPGILQIYLNILFYLSVFVFDSKFYRWLSALLIISTFSTTGFIILVLQILFFYWKYLFHGKSVWGRLVLLLLIPVIFILAYENVMLKTKGDGVASFDMRTYDLLNAVNLIRIFPMTGIGMDMNVYKEIQSAYLSSDLPDFTVNVFDMIGERGNTNSTIMLFASTGLILGGIYYVTLLKQHVFTKKKVVVFLIILLGNMSEPLLLGNFFLLFVCSTFYGPKFFENKNESLVYYQ
ncbi:hypothetical protein [Sediminibacterium sp. C3]|uniref:hypothetical protein n=1 Tax=Sediminibacterium sp. C3 TaxID=1267211 RepID=UPI001268EEC3|nr:hypothetical protein [Sediminibacterium sp. C3]